MAQAKAGDTVKVHYSGFLEDGTIFDSSLQGDPFEFTLGESMVLPGFEEAIVGMDSGETKTINIPSDEAYGPHREELVAVIERTHVPVDIDPQIGMNLQLKSPDGNATSVVITEVSEESIILDANHPLAGKDLIFEIKLVEIL